MLEQSSKFGFTLIALRPVSALAGTIRAFLGSYRTVAEQRTARQGHTAGCGNGSRAIGRFLHSAQSIAARHATLETRSAYVPQDVINSLSLRRRQP